MQQKEKKNYSFFSICLKGHERERKEKKKGGIVFHLIPHAIIPDIKINRATIRMQIPAPAPSPPPFQAQIRKKQQPRITDL